MPEGGLLGVARGVIELDAAPAIASLNEFAAKARLAGTQAESSLSSIGRSLTGLGQTLSLGATLPIVGLLGAAVKAAQSTQSAVRQVGAEFGVQSEEIDRFAQTTARSFGISENAALQASAKVGLLGQNIGIAADQLPKFDEQIISAAGNLAKFRGADPSDVLNAITAAVSGGRLLALKQYGIVLNQNKINQDALTESGKTNVKQLTSAELAQARLNEIMKQAAFVTANSADATNSLGFRMRVLHAELDDIAARVGAVLLPTLTDFAGLLLKMVDAATSLPPPILKIGVVVALAVAALGPLLILVGAMLPALAAMIGVVASVAAAFAGAGGAVALLLTPLGLIVAAIAAFGVAYATNFLGFRDLVNGVVGEVVSLLGTLTSAFANGIRIGLDPFSAALFAVGAVIDAIFGQHSTIALNADKVINQLLTFAVRVRDAIAALTAGNFKAAFADARAAFASLGQAALSLGAAILGGLSNIDWGAIAGAVVDGVRGAIGAIDWSAVPGDIEAALNTAIQAAKFGAIELGQIGAHVAGWLVDGVQDLWDQVVAFAARIFGSNTSDPNGGPGIDGTGGPAIPGRTLNLGAIGAHIAGWLADGARDLWAKVVAFGKGLLPTGKAAFVDLGQVATNVAGWTAGGASDLLAKVISFAHGLLAGNAGAVIGSENAAASLGGRRATIDLGQIGANVAGWVIGGATDLVAQITKRVRGLFAGGGGSVIGSENAAPGTTVGGGVDLGDWVLHVGAPTLVGWVETAAAWLQGKLDALVNTGRDWLVDLRKWIVSIKTPVFDAVGGVATFLQDALDALVNTGRDWLVDLKKWIVSIKTPIFDAVGGVASFLQRQLDELINTGRDWLVDLRKWVVSIKTPVFDAVGGVANFLQRQLDALVNTGRDWFVDLKKWVVSIKAPVFDAIGGAAKFIQGQLDGLVNTGRDWLVHLRKWIVSIKTPVFDAIGGVANFLQGQLDGLINTGRDWFVDLKKWVVSIKRPIFDAIGGVAGFLQSELDALINTGRDWLVDLKKWIVSIKAPVFDAVGGVGVFLQGQLDGLVNTGRDWFVGLKKWTVSVGAPGLVTWVADVLGWLRGQLTGLVGGSGAVIGSENAGASVFGGSPLADVEGWLLKVGIPTPIGWITDAATWVHDKIADAVNKAKLEDIGTSVGDKVAAAINAVKWATVGEDVGFALGEALAGGAKLAVALFGAGLVVAFGAIKSGAVVNAVADFATSLISGFVKGFGRAMDDQFPGIVTKLNKAVDNIVAAWNRLPGPVQGVVRQLGTSLGQVALIALGLGLTSVGFGLAASRIASALGSVGLAVKGVGTVLGLFGLTGGPAILAFLGLAAAAGLVYETVKHWDVVSKQLNDGALAISAVASAAIPAAIALGGLDPVLGLFILAGVGIGLAVTHWQDLKRAFHDIYEPAGDAYDVLHKITGLDFSVFASSLDPAFQAVNNMAAALRALATAYEGAKAALSALGATGRPSGTAAAPNQQVAAAIGQTTANVAAVANAAGGAADQMGRLNTQAAAASTAVAKVGAQAGNVGAVANAAGGAADGVGRLATEADAADAAFSRLLIHGLAVSALGTAGSNALPGGGTPGIQKPGGPGLGATGPGIFALPPGPIFSPADIAKAPPPDLSSLAPAAGKSFLDALGKVLSGVGAVMAKLLADVGRYAAGLAAIAGQVGTAGGSALNTALRGALATVNATMASLLAGIGGYAGGMVAIAGQVGAAGGASLSVALRAALGAVNGVMSSLLAGIGGYTGSLVAIMGQMGAAGGNSFASGLRGAGGAAFNAAASLVGNASAGISGLDFFGTGLNAGNSFANGLGAAAAAAFSAGFAVGQAALFGAQSATGAFSPARKFIDLANDVIDGLLIPLRRRASEVATAVGDLIGIPTTNLSASFASLQTTLAAQPGQAQSPQPTQVVNVFPLKSDEYQKLISDARWGSEFATDMVSGRGKSVALGR